MLPSPRRKNWVPWSAWGLSTATGSALLAISLLGGGSQRRWFMPGKTTDAHHQLELECEACHAVAFTAAADLQAACERCHAAELDEAKDSHPESKFTDPRNAARVAALDARRCVTCHVEHRMAATREGSVTVPEDYCIKCHAGVADERPSHRGLAFDSCDDAGCHNFHDNFLVKRLDEPALLPNPGVPARNAPAEGLALSAAELHQARQSGMPVADLDAWAGSAHGRARTGCTSCHGAEPGRLGSVPVERCAQCHSLEVQTWQAGKHGVRNALHLDAMLPSQARLQMHAGASQRPLNCNACHAAHAYDRDFAAMQACLGCHADDHSRAYASSRHAASFENERRGLGPSGSGVSCATCHMPRLPADDGRSVTQHNQNDNLRPNEKMIRPVCGQCHGSSFSIDALADAALVRANFNGSPSVHVDSGEMARRRAEKP